MKDILVVESERMLCGIPDLGRVIPVAGAAVVATGAGLDAVLPLVG